MAALGSQSIASSYEQLLHVDRDNGGNGTTHVSVKDGDNGTTFGFTIASDALMMSSTNRLEFGDTGTYIHQSADGVLDLVSDTEIEINATTIDMNGALDLSGNAQLSGTVTVGADGSGTDVIFYSGTAGDNFTWDASAEKLTITGTNGQTALDVADGNLVVADNIDCEGDIDINGTANLDAVDIDGAVQIDNTVTVGESDTGYDVKFFGATATNGYMLWDESTDDLILGTSSNLGLGVTSTNYKLNVHEASAGGAWIQITDSDTGTGASDGFLVGINGNEAASLYNAESTDMIFSTAATQRMTINSGGNVGIGDTDPSEAKLSIANVAAGDSSLSIDHDIDTICISVDA